MAINGVYIHHLNKHTQDPKNHKCGTLTVHSISTIVYPINTPNEMLGVLIPIVGGKSTILAGNHHVQLDINLVILDVAENRG